MKDFMKNKIILLTGGTGSFGTHFIHKTILKYKPKQIIVFSRDEMKQWDLQNKLSKYSKVIKFIIGDVRDKNKVNLVMKNVDIVVHAAATKIVTSAEKNPFEAIKTNILGAVNIIEASIFNNVKKVIALSTDKACNPINLYGATKLASDKLFVSSNFSDQISNTSFSVVRYGNVMGSRGSIIPKFLEQAKKGTLNVTDPNMTRFNITLKDSVKMVLFALENMKGAEILVPKIPSYKIIDLAKSIGPNCKIKVIGVRPGEKIHEEMISESDSFTTFDIGDYYIILPAQNKSLIGRYKKFNIKKVQPNFRYASGTNSKFLNIKELRFLIKKYVKN